MRSVASDVAAYLTEKKSSAKFAARLVTVPWTSPIGRLPLMTEEGRPTGIRYEDAVDAARRGGNVDFEGRKVRLVSINGSLLLTGIEVESLARKHPIKQRS